MESYQQRTSSLLTVSARVKQILILLSTESADRRPGYHGGRIIPAANFIDLTSGGPVQPMVSGNLNRESKPGI
jgi:hypothetical protein